MTSSQIAKAIMAYCAAQRCSDPPNFKWRNLYLKSWIQTYIAHQDAIKDGFVNMPKLYWRHTDKAPFVPFSAIHRVYTQCGCPIEVCGCEISILLRQMFDHVRDGEGTYNLIEIFNTYNNLNRSIQ